MRSLMFVVVTLLLFLPVHVQAGTIVFVDPGASSYSSGSYYYSQRSSPYTSFYWQPAPSYSSRSYYDSLFCCRTPALTYAHGHYYHNCNRYCPDYIGYVDYPHGHRLHICDSGCRAFSNNFYYYHGHPSHYCNRDCTWYNYPTSSYLTRRAYPHGHRNHSCDRTCQAYSRGGTYYYHGHRLHECTSACSYFVAPVTFYYAHGHDLHVCDSRCGFYSVPVYYGHGHSRHICNSGCAYFSRPSYYDYYGRSNFSSERSTRTTRPTRTADTSNKGRGNSVPQGNSSRTSFRIEAPDYGSSVTDTRTRSTSTARSRSNTPTSSDRFQVETGGGNSVSSPEVMNYAPRTTSRTSSFESRRSVEQPSVSRSFPSRTASPSRSGNSVQ